MSDHTQGNWNGIVGRIEFRCHETIWVDQLTVTGDLDRRIAFVQGRLARTTKDKWPEEVLIEALDKVVSPKKIPVKADGSFEAAISYNEKAKAWDEFHPVLNPLRVSLPNGETKELRFGFRKIEARGNQLLINGQPLFLRGTLDCAIFPRTGHPAMKRDEWRAIFATIKRHGLNHVRFHSWCPPSAAFEAADELGLYLQIEVASWPNQSTTLGDGAPVDDWLERETQRILQAYGDHPSFLFLAAGNEPGGKNHAPWLMAWLARRKAADARRLYTGGSGWPELTNNDYHVTPDPRIQAWGAGLKSRINARPPETRTDYSDFINTRKVPVVSHEIGQWCVYPNFAEMPKYSGYLKPRNYEIFRASLEKKGMLALAPDFLKASGKLQALCYKEDIEAALRTHHMGGFQLLGLQDFPGQGTALVGVLDAFWEEKGYITPEEFRRFCGPTVPLARLDKRVFIEGEHLACDIELSHFGATPLHDQAALWRLENESGVRVAEGRFQARDIPVGATCALGHLDVSLAGLKAPAKYKLVVSLPTADALNDWDLWVYPKPEYLETRIPEDVHVTSKLDATTEARLSEGATVWLMLDKGQVRGDVRRGPIALGFSSIFWNTAWTEGQAPHTLGILCNPAHPALAGFPTEMHSNWQWWYPLSQATPLILDDLPHAVRPIVQVIDDWVTNRKLALVFEARVAKGKLLVTSIGLNDSSLDPVRRQLRASLLAYIRGTSFKPDTELSLEQVRSLLATKATQ